MGLRDFLTGMEQFSKGAQAFGEGVQASDQRDALEEFNAQSPTLLQEIRDSTDKTKQAQAAAKFNALAIKSGKAKDDPMMEQVAKFMFNNAGGDAPLAGPDLLAIRNDLTGEEVAGISQLKSKKDQMAAIAQKNNKVKEEGVQGRFGANYARNTGNDAVKQGTKVYDVLNKSDDAFREQDYKLKEIETAIKTKSTIGDNIAMNYIARAVAQEKGPLNEGDIKRIQGITGMPGTIDEIRERFRTSGPEIYAKLSPAQRKLMAQFVQENATQFRGKRAESTAYDLNGMYQTQTKLRDSEGNPTGILKERLESYQKQGIPVKFENGKFTVTKTQKTVGGNMSKLMSAANSIKDPVKKQQALKALSSRDESIFDDEATMGKYMGRIKELGAQ